MTRLTDLIRVTKSRNLILADGSMERNYLRAPHDVQNIPALLGVDSSLGKKMITHNIRIVVLHGEQRKTVKGVISVVEAETTEKKQNKRTIDKL